MKKILLRLFFIITLTSLYAGTFAQDTSRLRISLLTCTPGDELYSTFGHSAFRLTDSSSKVNGEAIDIVFNYGTFNFDDPGFYTKFVRGKLLYYVSTAYFKDFVEEYQLTNRGITEQVLNLTSEEKIAIQRFLYNNAKDENKYYKYDFLFDNCTTRLRDIIIQHKKIKPAFKRIVPAGTTFRNEIYKYLDRGDKEWSKLGIDILLGAPTDAIMDSMQVQFLPNNLMKALDSSNHGNNLVLAKTNLYPYEESIADKSFFNPLILFSIFLLVIVALDFSKNKFAARFLYGFDGLLFFLVGAAGILLVFMWLGTDHAMCKNNYNLLWAWPTHAVVAFFIHKKKSWVKKYLMLTVAGLLIVTAAWMFLPQQMNYSLLPVCLLLIYRSLRNYQSL